MPFGLLDYFPARMYCWGGGPRTPSGLLWAPLARGEGVGKQSGPTSLCGQGKQSPVALHLDPWPAGGVSWCLPSGKRGAGGTHAASQLP